ncbi:hypothetical protein ADK64_35390 [Streptomyces sp. MMG1121]|nr:hypothetical protein ADK64_35390 [Streptomyces sp. MMG1121]
MVLAETDLTAIAHAIGAGRCAGGNIATYLRITLSSNLGNVIAMLSAGLLVPFLPMLPAQVLTQNLCFDAAQLDFAHGRPADPVLRRPTLLRPRDPLRFITGFGVLNALADRATFAVLAFVLHGLGTGVDEAVFHSGWLSENLITQALVMVLLRIGRRGAEARRPGPAGWAATALAVVGPALPASPLGLKQPRRLRAVQRPVSSGVVVGLQDCAIIEVSGGVAPVVGEEGRLCRAGRFGECVRRICGWVPPWLKSKESTRRC